MPTNDKSKIFKDEDRKWPPIQFNEQQNDPEKDFQTYVDVGDQIMRWANGDDELPRTMDDLRSAFGKNVDIPANMKNLVVVQGPDEDPDNTVFVLRLPPRNQLSESDEQLQQNGTQYPLPGIYESKLETAGKDVDPQQMLRARVADYTMRGCR